MKGILLIEELFNKTVAGQKTQTRRINKSIKGFYQKEWDFLDMVEFELNKPIAELSHKDTGQIAHAFPRFNEDEIIFIKEPYHIGLNGKPVYLYGRNDASKMADEINGVKWKNKMFMPEKYARHYIKITGIKVEPVMDITEQDAIKEGCNSADEYARLWDKINKDLPFSSNPFVWVYDYELIKQNEQ
jgi:hypothetical protein